MPEIVFLDEIWKAGPAILNTLLTAINERKYRNGDSESAIPMRLRWWPPPTNCRITTAAWKPSMTGCWIRLWLDKLQEKQSFRAMLTVTPGASDEQIPAHLQVTDEEYHQWQEEIDRVVLTDQIFELIYQLRQQIERRITRRISQTGAESTAAVTGQCVFQRPQQYHAA